MLRRQGAGMITPRSWPRLSRCLDPAHVADPAPGPLRVRSAARCAFPA